MKRITVLGMLLAMLSITSGCETVKGVGRDITKAGEAIEDAAR